MKENSEWKTVGSKWQREIKLCEPPFKNSVVEPGLRHKALIPVFRRQEDCQEFKTSLGLTARPWLEINKQCGNCRVLEIFVQGMDSTLVELVSALRASHRLACSALPLSWTPALKALLDQFLNQAPWLKITERHCSVNLHVCWSKPAECHSFLH